VDKVENINIINSRKQVWSFKFKFEF